MPSRLQPILLLDPSVSHTPLLTGESCCFPRGGAGSLHPGKADPSAARLSVHLPAESLPPPPCPCFCPFSSMVPPHATPHVLSSARVWAPALPLCPVPTDHRAALWVRPPLAAEPDPLRTFAPKRHRPPITGPPAAPPGAAQPSRPADQGEGNWVGEVVGLLPWAHGG